MSDVRPEIPRGVADAIAKALAKKPEDRHETATRFAEALTADRSLEPTVSSDAFDVPTAIPNNLPAERTRFIGREKEMAECERLLAETRLLTLTGIAAAERPALRSKSRRDCSGVIRRRLVVDLAPADDPSRVAETAGAALGVREVATEFSGRAPTAGPRKRPLLVLDHCEHLLTASAELADAVLRSGEAVRILATSREGLGVEGERLYGLRSLAVPSQAIEGDSQAWGAVEAVKLFVDRAQTAVNGFSLTEENAGAIAEVCRRLDGIPLAIELAAARVRMLSAGSNSRKARRSIPPLDRNQQDGVAEAPDSPATIQWSYDQLSPASSGSSVSFRSLRLAGRWSPRRVSPGRRVTSSKCSTCCRTSLTSHSFWWIGSGQ